MLFFMGGVEMLGKYQSESCKMVEEEKNRVQGNEGKNDLVKEMKENSAFRDEKNKAEKEFPTSPQQHQQKKGRDK